MNVEGRNCHICGSFLIKGQYCIKCTEKLHTLPPAKQMTMNERRAEVQMWGDELEIPFDLYRKRIDELMGRHLELHEYIGGVSRLLVLLDVETLKELGTGTLLGEKLSDEMERLERIKYDRKSIKRYSGLTPERVEVRITDGEKLAWCMDERRD